MSTIKSFKEMLKTSNSVLTEIYIRKNRVSRSRIWSAFGSKLFKTKCIVVTLHLLLGHICQLLNLGFEKIWIDAIIIIIILIYRTRDFYFIIMCPSMYQYILYNAIWIEFLLKYSFLSYRICQFWLGFHS